MAPRNLRLKVPRTGRAGVMFALLLTAGAVAVAGSGAFPRLGFILIFAAGLVLVLWRLLPSTELEFDMRSGFILKNGRRVARFADVECVQITEPAGGERHPHFGQRTRQLFIVELRLAGAQVIRLGHSEYAIDASSLAAEVAGAIDRPVKVSA